MLSYATSLEQLQSMLCDFKRSTKKVGLKIHPEKTRNLSNQTSQGRSITCARVREVSRNNNFTAIRNDGKQKQNPSSSGVVLQIQARVDVEIVPSAALVTLVKYGALSCNGLRVRNMDLDKRTRKIPYTKRKMLRPIVQTRRKYKKRRWQTT